MRRRLLKHIFQDPILTTRFLLLSVCQGIPKVQVEASGTDGKWLRRIRVILQVGVAELGEDGSEGSNFGTLDAAVELRVVAVGVGETTEDGGAHAVFLVEVGGEDRAG